MNCGKRVAAIDSARRAELEFDWSWHLLHFEADWVVGGVHGQSVGCASLQLHVFVPQLRKCRYDAFGKQSDTKTSKRAKRAAA